MTKNKDKFGNILADLNWEAVLQNKNANTAMDTFYQHLLTAYNKSFPFVKLSRKQAKDKSWITSALESSIEEKRRLYRRLLLNQNKKHNIQPNVEVFELHIKY